MYIYIVPSLDDDECTDGTDDCDDANGVCTNSPGSSLCHCKPGYSGNGVTCTGNYNNVRDTYKFPHEV